MKNILITNFTSSTPVSTQPEQNQTTYSGKAIQFYKRGNIYYLFIGGDFGISDDRTTFIDLHKDLLAADKNCELHIFIQTDGGEIDCLTMLVEEIVKFANVVTICTGRAYSAGFNTFMIGREKYISPVAVLMYHSAQMIGQCCESVHNLTDNFNKVIDREKDVLTYLSLDKYLTPEEIEKGKTSEIFFTGKECIARGWAKPYSDYASRLTYGIVQDNKGNLYKSDSNGIFTKYVPSKSKKDKLTLPQLNGFV